MAAALLVGGLALWIWPPGDQGTLVQLQAACWRIGGCLAVLWLAYPDLRNIPRWLWIALPVLILVLAKWPRLFLLVIPLLILYAFIRPRLSNTG
jgi:hypothetical protein